MRFALCVSLLIAFCFDRLVSFHIIWSPRVVSHPVVEQTVSFCDDSFWLRFNLFCWFFAVVLDWAVLYAASASSLIAFWPGLAMRLLHPRCWADREFLRWLFLIVFPPWWFVVVLASVLRAASDCFFYRALIFLLFYLRCFTGSEFYHDCWCFPFVSLFVAGFWLFGLSYVARRMCSVTDCFIPRHSCVVFICIAEQRVSLYVFLYCCCIALLFLIVFMICGFLDWAFLHPASFSLLIVLLTGVASC